MIKGDSNLITGKSLFIKLKEDCSAGCPCSDFDCAAPTSVPTTTTTTLTTTSISPTRNAVLVISTYDSNNKPFIVDFNG